MSAPHSLAPVGGASHVVGDRSVIRCWDDHFWVLARDGRG